jgi:hypothetical protein
MKKDPKLTRRLQLNRETLLALEQPELGAVVGGVFTKEVVATCYACNTRNTCTTRLC